MGFELIDNSSYLKPDLQRLKGLLIEMKKLYSPDYPFFDYSDSVDKLKPRDVGDICGLQYEAVGQGEGEFCSPHIWRISEGVTGVQIMAYEEDCKSGNNENIYINRYARRLLRLFAFVNFFTNKINFDGEVIIRIHFSGLAERALLSSRDNTPAGIIAKQDCKDKSMIIKKPDLNNATSEYKAVEMIESVNKLFLGPRLTVDDII